MTFASATSHLSVDYIVRLEQGKVTALSGQVVAALAHVLQLTRTERDHLYGLAGLQPPGDRAISDQLTPEVQRLLTRLEEVSAAVFPADRQMVWWNRSWAALPGDPSSVAPQDRSLVSSSVPTPSSRERIMAWPAHSNDPEASDCHRSQARERTLSRRPETG